MQVVIAEPTQHTTVQNIDDGLEAMQKIVGGTIQAIYPFEEPIALICNDEGKFLNLPLNRALRDNAGCVYDIVAGTVLLCAAPTDKDNFASLTEEQVQTCLKRFAIPEQFIQVGDGVFVLPAP